MKKNRIILTGEKQVGKSTVCRELLDLLAPKELFGLRTFRIPGGFALSGWSGKPIIFARWDMKGHEFENLQIDLSVFNSAGPGLLNPPSLTAWRVMDELGIMEQRADVFVKAAQTAWAGPNPAIAVIQKRALDFWLQQFQKNPCPVYEITLKNRDAAPGAIAQLLSSKNFPVISHFEFVETE